MPYQGFRIEVVNLQDVIKFNELLTLNFTAVMEEEVVKEVVTVVSENWLVQNHLNTILYLCLSVCSV